MSIGTSDVVLSPAKYNKIITRIQDLLDHAKWLHDCLDEIPCDLCEKTELKLLEQK